MTVPGNVLSPDYSIVVFLDYAFQKLTNFIIFTIGFNMKLHTISDCSLSH